MASKRTRANKPANDPLPLLLGRTTPLPDKHCPFVTRSSPRRSPPNRGLSKNRRRPFPASIPCLQHRFPLRARLARRARFLASRRRPAFRRPAPRCAAAAGSRPLRQGCRRRGSRLSSAVLRSPRSARFSPLAHASAVPSAVAAVHVGRVHDGRRLLLRFLGFLGLCRVFGLDRVDRLDGFGKPLLGVFEQRRLELDSGLHAILEDHRGRAEVEVAIVDGLGRVADRAVQDAGIGVVVVVRGLDAVEAPGVLLPIRVPFEGAPGFPGVRVVRIGAVDPNRLQCGMSGFLVAVVRITGRAGRYSKRHAGDRG